MPSKVYILKQPLKISKSEKGFSIAFWIAKGIGERLGRQAMALTVV